MRYRRAASSGRSAEVEIHPLQAGDLEAIIELDARVNGQAAPEYWQRKCSPLTRAGAERGGAASVAAEVQDRGCVGRVAKLDGQIIGFLIGEIRVWDIRRRPSAWITDLTVDQDFRAMGVGRRLLAEVLDCFREQGLAQVRTLIDWSDGELLSFLSAMGFDRGPWIVLEKKLGLE